MNEKEKKETEMVETETRNYINGSRVVADPCVVRKTVNLE